MAIWERYQAGHTVAAAGVHVNSELLHNFQGAENFESGDIVFVDGILTVITDTDDLCGVRLLIAHENITSGALTEDSPAPHEPGVWYSWFCARGPLVFRMRSKKTLPPEHKLWLQTWKALGSTSTICNSGILLYEQFKHQ